MKSTFLLGLLSCLAFSATSQRTFQNEYAVTLGSGLHSFSMKDFNKYVAAAEFPETDPILKSGLQLELGAFYRFRPIIGVYAKAALVGLEAKLNGTDREGNTARDLFNAEVSYSSYKLGVSVFVSELIDVDNDRIRLRADIAIGPALIDYSLLAASNNEILFQTETANASSAEIAARIDYLLTKGKLFSGVSALIGYQRMVSTPLIRRGLAEVWVPASYGEEVKLDFSGFFARIELFIGGRHYQY